MIDRPNKMLRLRTVLDRTGLSRSTLYRKIREGTFPRQIPISTNGSGWHENEVSRWIANPPAYRSGSGVSESTGALYLDFKPLASAVSR